MPSGTIAENFVTGNVQSTEERDALCGFLDAYGWASRRRAVNDPVARPYFQFDSPYTPIDIGNAGLGSQGYPQKLWPAVSYAKFQIISAGNDGVFGEGGNADSQSGATGNLKTNFFEKADLDNLTNFSEGTIDTARDQ